LPRRHVPDEADRGPAAAHDDNRRAVDEACELNAACLVLVVGGLPGALAGKAAHKDIALSRSQVMTASPRCWNTPGQARCRWPSSRCIPMYAADRACVNTTEQALDVCDRLDPTAPARSASRWTCTTSGGTPSSCPDRARRQDRLLAFHVCDWLTPTNDLLNDRGMMGDGVIDIPKIRGWVEAQGFAGYSEVEIFSAGNWWQRDSGEILDTCIARHRTAV
jgi:sugar phosphate isomerase/epimerase